MIRYALTFARSQKFTLKHYHHREGVFNLAGYLPDHCLKPELGPKMYIAYGSARYSDKGSTNLHIDMSDAVNYLVYVGFPSGDFFLERNDNHSLNSQPKNKIL